MFNFRENIAEQLTSRDAAEILMRTDLLVCTIWVFGLGIMVCKRKDAGP